MSNKTPDFETEEYFLNSPAVNSTPSSAAETDNNDPIPAVNPVEEKAADVSFEESLSLYSSANVPKGKKRKKRKLGVNGMVRLVALCLCLGLFAFSLSNIVSRMNDFSAADEFDAMLGKKDSVMPALRNSRPVPTSKDLLQFLGSDIGGIEMFDSLDTNKQDYYESLRNKLYEGKEINEESWAYIVVKDTAIDYLVMKGDDNDEYLYRLPNREASKKGSIFADSSLRDEYEENRNVVLYGHCMTDGTRFRALKLFFDSANRYTKAQEMEITVVTEKAVYVYEYFSGYRAEGDAFAYCYSTDTSSKRFYNYLKGRRALNTISKDVTYDGDSKIITLITCTNLSSKPAERYVLHGILKNVYYF